MADRCKFIIKRYETNKRNPVGGVLQEVIEIDLPGNYDLNSLQMFLESDKAFSITNSYYQLNRNYYHCEMGVGASFDEIVLQIWNNIPEELKGVIISKTLEVGLKLSGKIIKKVFSRKATRDEKRYIKKEYGLAIDKIEVTNINNTEIKVNIYRK